MSKTQQNCWQSYSLIDVLDLIGGGTPKTTVPEYWNGDIPWLSVVDFNTGKKFVFESEKKITEEGLLNSNTKILNKGDIIISARGTVGIIAMIGRSMAFNQSCYGIRAKDNLAINDFIYYLLKNTVANFLQKSHGGVFDTITQNTFKEIEIDLPPLSEQKVIAEVLSSLDDKIELLHRQNKTLEDMAQALFQNWFVEKMDENWKIGKLDDFISLIESGSRPKGGIDPNLRTGIPSIGAENIKGIGKYDYSKTKFISENFFKEMRRGIVKDFDVLIYKDGAYVGRKGMFAANYPYKVCTINEHVFILRCRAKYSAIFLYFLLQENDLAQLNSNSAQPGLNQEALKSFKIISPPEYLINNFGNIVEPYIDKIFLNAKQIVILNNLRDVLLPKLINGDVKVKY